MGSSMWIFATTLALIIGLSSAAIPQYASTIRPPAYPLAVRNPYLNLWLNRNELPGTWATFWTGTTKAWTGLIKIDNNVTYLWMGNPSITNVTLPRAIQNAAITTPTQTHFHLTAGSVDLNVTFFSPVEAHDIPRQSIPLSYVFVDVASNDGMPHDVQLYMDISSEWATSDLGQIITWGLSTTSMSGLKVWSTQRQTEDKFRERDEYAEWGSAVLAGSGNSTHASGSDQAVRTAFVTTGKLDNTNDVNFRCARCDWPTFGLALNLSTVTAAAKRAQYVVGTYREENANLMGKSQYALWLQYWPTLAHLLDFFWADVDQSLMRADKLDVTILDDAFAAGGQQYADILTFSLRQSYAGNEFSGAGEAEPLYYQKEISSGAFMNTVDVIFPATPMFIYLNITYLQLLLEPLFFQMETGIWTEPFAMHDIGDLYPNALGQGYGGDMPVEESANMLLMVGDIVFHPSSTVEAGRAYAQKHWAVMVKWADYLQYNCLYPVDQLTTDDFIGHTELNSGLALKGILGMKTFAKIATLVGNTTLAQLYNDKVDEYMPIWYNESIHMDGTHLKMEYNVTNGYQFKYNALHDKLLDLNIVPESVYKMEADYYLTKLEPYGIPFVNRHDYTKSDWEMWTAAAFGDANPELKDNLIRTLGNFLRVTPQRVPFTDWYVTATTNQVGFQARPVAGGHFALLALDKMKKSRQQ